MFVSGPLSAVDYPEGLSMPSAGCAFRSRASGASSGRRLPHVVRAAKPGKAGAVVLPALLETQGSQEGEGALGGRGWHHPNVGMA
jgi:hypothetical protein